MWEHLLGNGQEIRKAEQEQVSSEKLMDPTQVQAKKVKWTEWADRVLCDFRSPADRFSDVYPKRAQLSRTIVRGKQQREFMWF
jgi:hypothetical protein